MPATPKGTAYTVTTAPIPGHTQALYGVADAVKNSADIPTVVFCHGAGGSYSQFSASSAWDDLRFWLIDNGWAWVEGSGGPSYEQGAQHWASPYARAAYTAYIDWLDSKINAGVMVPLGRSMGGLMASWLYLRSPIASRCGGMIANAGVQTIAYGTVSDPDPDRRPTAQHFGYAMRIAYGVDNYNDLIAASLDHDPMNWDPTLWDGKKVLQIAGTADTTVPPHTRGYEPLRALYSGRTAVDLVDLKVGGDHSGGDAGTINRTEAMTSFLASIGGGAPAVPPEPFVYVEHSRMLYQGGALYPLSSTTRP